MEEVARFLRERREVPKPPGESEPTARDPVGGLETKVVRGDRCTRCCALEAEWAVSQMANAMYQALSLGPGEGMAVEESARGRPGAPGAGGRAPIGRPRAIPFGGGTGRAVPPGMEVAIPEGHMDDPTGICVIRMGKAVAMVEQYAERLAEFYREGGGCEDCCRRQALSQTGGRQRFTLTYRGQPAGTISTRKAAG